MGKKFLCFLLVANPIAGWLLRVLLNYRFSRKAVNWGYRKLGLLEHAYGRAAHTNFQGPFFVDIQVTLPAGKGTITLGLVHNETLVGTRVVQLTEQETPLLVENLVLEAPPSGDFKAQIYADDSGALPPRTHLLGSADVKTVVAPLRRYPLYSSKQVNYENAQGIVRAGGLQYSLEGNTAKPQRLVVYCGDSVVSQDAVNSAHTAISPRAKGDQDTLVLCIQNPLFYQQPTGQPDGRISAKLEKLVRKVIRHYKLSTHQTTVIGLHNSATLAIGLGKTLPGASLLTTSPTSEDKHSVAELIEYASTGLSKLHLFCSNDESIVEAANKVQKQGLEHSVHLYRFNGSSSFTRHAQHQTIQALLQRDLSSPLPVHQWLKYQSEDQLLLHVRITSKASRRNTLPSLWIEERIGSTRIHVRLEKHPSVPHLYYLKQPVSVALGWFADSRPHGTVRPSPVTPL